MSDTTQSNLVYGWFINDSNHILDIPNNLTNVNNTEKCVYVGKVTEGKHKKRTWADRIREHSANYKNSNHSEYNTSKYVFLRLCDKEGIEVEHRKLSNLTGGEEFEQYVKYTVAGHPTMNEKYGDKITNFKDEIISLIESGVIKDEEDFKKSVKQLQHEYKLSSDKAYVEREQRKTARLQKMVIEDYIESAFSQMEGRTIRIGNFVELIIGSSFIGAQLNSSMLSRMKKGGDLYILSQGGKQWDDMQEKFSFWLHIGIGWRTPTTGEKIQKRITSKITKEFKTDEGYDLDKFFNSIGKFNFGKIK